MVGGPLIDYFCSLRPVLISSICLRQEVWSLNHDAAQPLQLADCLRCSSLSPIEPTWPEVSSVGISAPVSLTSGSTSRWLKADECFLHSDMAPDGRPWA